MPVKRKYLLAVIMPMLILLGTTISPVSALMWGEEAVLQTVPLDPRDLFRGDHVILQYVINEIDTAGFGEIDKTQWDKGAYGQKVYVSLKKEGQYHVVDSVSRKEPQKGIYLKGKIRYVDTFRNIAYVDYRLDKFFVPENTGQEFEEQSREGNLLAKVNIYKGYGLLIDIVPEDQ